MSNNTGTKALQAGIWYTISSIAVKAINIVTTPIFTRMMSTSDYGMAQTFSSWFALLSIFGSLNLTYSIGRAKLDFPGQLDKFVGSMQTLALIASSIIGTVLIIFIKPAAMFMEMNSILIVILVVYLISNPVITLTQNKYKYQYRYKGNIFIAGYTTVTSILFSLGLMLCFANDRYYAKILGSVIASVALSSFFWIRLIIKKNVNINITYWKYGLNIALPLILHSVSLSVLSQSDRIMITKFIDTDATGIYSLAYSYAILINIFLNAVNEAWLPWFHDTLFAGEKEKIKSNVKYLVVFGCMLGIGCIAIAPEAINILGPEEYQLGKWVVGPVALGLICQFIYQQYVHIELHEKKTKYISYGSIIAAGLNIILNFVFIPKYGFIAAAYTTLFCYFVLMFVHLFITKYILKVRLYNDLFMFAALLITSVFVVIFMLLYKTIVIRYFSLAITCFIYVYLNRNIIINVIKQKMKK